MTTEGLTADRLAAAAHEHVSGVILSKADVGRVVPALRILEAMENKHAELVVERIGLLDLIDYHQGVIDSGMHAVHNFYEKRKAQDRVIRINEELRPLIEWLGEGGE